MARIEGYPTFNQAVEQFRSFLKSQGLPEDVLWLNPEDAVLVERRVFVRPPKFEVAWRRASREYSRGRRRGLGVELGVVCRIDGRVCCYIYIPKNEDEAERRMMPDGLKLSVSISVPHGEVVESRLKWIVVALLARRGRRGQRQFLFRREG